VGEKENDVDWKVLRESRWQPRRKFAPAPSEGAVGLSRWKEVGLFTGWPLGHVQRSERTELRELGSSSERRDFLSRYVATAVGRRTLRGGSDAICEGEEGRRRAWPPRLPCSGRRGERRGYFQGGADRPSVRKSSPFTRGKGGGYGGREAEYFSMSTKTTEERKKRPTAVAKKVGGKGRNLEAKKKKIKLMESSKRRNPRRVANSNRRAARKGIGTWKDKD